MYRSMKINEFKHLRDINVTLGRSVTVISGLNATGKSTILSLLGHSAKNESITLLGKPFNTRFEDIMKASYNHEIVNNRAVEFTICDNAFEHDIERFYYRTYWNFEHDERKRRYRVLPIRLRRTHKDSKYECPAYYLGLSRLFPIGETRTVQAGDLVMDMTENDKEYITSNHIQILSMRHLVERDENVRLVGLNAVSKKKTYGLEMQNYGPMCNSAGQDNVTQILAALRSFEKLKSITPPEDWKNGLFIIDELDASLFPITQIKLFDFLRQEASRIGIQIVVTTHSLKLLDHICETTEQNISDRNNDIELHFLSNATRRIESRRNPSFQFITYQLLNTGGLTRRKKIRIITEDQEAQWFFRQLVPRWEDYYCFNRLSLGDADMKKLVNDPDIFDKTILLHDGDVTYTENELQKVEIQRTPGSRGVDLDPTQYIREYSSNVVILPSMNSNLTPEELLWNVIEGQLHEDNSPIWTLDDNITQMFFMDDINRCRPELFQEAKARNRSKSWFKKLKETNEDFMKRVVNCWIQNNYAEYEQFITYLAHKTKIVSKKNGLTFDSTDAAQLKHYSVVLQAGQTE